MPDTGEVTYDTTEIHRATSENGSYSLLASQAIADNTYFDIDGSTSNWYKVRFELSGAYSDFSDPIQGGEFNGYCSFDDVRAVSGITSSQFTDSQIFNAIKNFSIGEVNSDISVEHRDERVFYISLEKENKVDGLNTTFYAKNWPLCDLNDDGIVDESDLEVYTLDANGTRTTYAVSSVDDVWLSKFTLSSAPAQAEDLFIKRYRSAPVEVYPNVHPNVRKACAFITAAQLIMRREAGSYGSWRAGRVSQTKRNPNFQYQIDQYNKILYKIKSSAKQEKAPEQTKRIASFFEGD